MIKNILWALVVLLAVIIMASGHRYVLQVNSPVVVKMDRLTGDTWIVNSGAWIKIKSSPDTGIIVDTKTPAANVAAKTK